MIGKNKHTVELEIIPKMFKTSYKILCTYALYTPNILPTHTIVNKADKLLEDHLFPPYLFIKANASDEKRMNRACIIKFKDIKSKEIRT